MTETKKTLVQCDFDGTVTEEDASFVMLDAFADGDWRQLFEQYHEGKISVGRFNMEAFATVKADRQSLLRLIKDTVKVRPGFHELVACCRSRGFRFVIVSNGLEFYINKILGDIGLADIEVFAARTEFHQEGLEVQYAGPDGRRLDEEFKGTYLNSFLAEGYRVVYLGNGDSDLSPARRCHHVFATGTLLERCQQIKLDCTPFTDFHEVVRVLELW